LQTPTPEGAKPSYVSFIGHMPAEITLIGKELKLPLRKQFHRLTRWPGNDPEISGRIQRAAVL
jgi:hypothetical protein